VIHWEDTVPLFEYDPKAPFFSILVPTVDTVRYTSILDILVQIGK
jgi:dynein heavy chain